jgi:hypothetical protein
MRFILISARRSDCFCSWRWAYREEEKKKKKRGRKEGGRYQDEIQIVEG